MSVHSAYNVGRVVGRVQDRKVDQALAVPVSLAENNGGLSLCDARAGATPRAAWVTMYARRQCLFHWHIASVRRDAEFGPLSGHSGLWQAARLADLWVHRLLVGRRDQAGQGGQIQRG